MDLCENINNAKCCIVSFADAYVKASTFGTSTREMLDELLLLNGYANALENYDCDPKKKVKKSFSLLDNGTQLTNDGVPLSIKKTVSVECNPDDVNCLKQEEICFILEQINISCNNCQCGC